MYSESTHTHLYATKSLKDMQNLNIQNKEVQRSFSKKYTNYYLNNKLSKQESMNILLELG